MQTSNNTPLTWLQWVVTTLQWPFIVIAAFWVGRLIAKLEMRAIKAESNVTALIERHMPSLHNALSEIRGMLGRR